MFINILVALSRSIAIGLSIERGLGYRLPPLKPLALFLLMFAVVSIARRRIRHRFDHPSAPTVILPVSGPIRRFPNVLTLVFVLSSCLSVLNPFQLSQSVRQMRGNARSRGRLRRPQETMADEYRNEAVYSLPFSGEWFVANGGVTRADSHSWDMLTQRYAYDFFVVDESLRRHTAAGTKTADYYCYGREILAAADGLVVRTESRIGTAPLVGYGVFDFLARSFLGNHTVIRHGEHEYGLYAHLVPRSLLVSTGESVRRGQIIGRCGHTGASTEPHLHFHLQDREDFFTAAGLPVKFTNLLVDGNEVAEGYVRRGQRVQARNGDGERSRKNGEL